MWLVGECADVSNCAIVIHAPLLREEYILGSCSFHSFHSSSALPSKRELHLPRFASVGINSALVHRLIGYSSTVLFLHSTKLPCFDAI